MEERKKTVLTGCLEIVYPPFLYLVVLNLAAWLVAALFGEKTYLKHGVLVSLVVMILVTPVLYYSYRKDKLKQKAFYSEAKKAGIAVYLLTAAGCFLLALLPGFILGVLNLHDSFPEYTQMTTRIYSENGVIVLLSSLVMAPIMEELIFRGLCFGRIRRFAGKGMTIVLTGLLFGLYHMNLLQFLYGSIMGMVFAALYERYRDLRLVILAHFAANLCSVALSFSSLHF